MRSWWLPSAAAAFWTGLLAWPLFRGHVPGWGLPVVIALALFGLACIAAPRARSEHEGALESAGLLPPVSPGVAVPPTSPVVEALTLERSVHDPSSSVVVALVLVGLVLTGAARAAISEGRLDRSLLAQLPPAHVAVEGSLRTDPSANAIGWSAIVDVSRVEALGAAWTLHESVWASGHGPPPLAARWDRVTLEGDLLAPDAPDFAQALRRKGIAAELQVSSVERIGAASNPLVRATQVFRAFVGRSIARLFPSREAGLLMGLALGDDSRMDPAVGRDFQATGLGHLLVVSGENVAMVLAPMLGLALLLRLRRWSRFVVGVGTVVFFVVLTGAEPSVMRAGVMACLTLFGVLLGRPRDAGAILAAAVLLLLVLDPWLVWSVGFQLSVAATAGMVALAAPLAERIRFLPKPAALAIGTTLAAQLGVAPLLLFHFHEVPLVTVLANLVAFPAVSPALVLGLLAGGAALVWLPLGRVLAGAAIVPLRYLEVVADRLAKAPLGWITGGGPLALGAGVGLAAGLAWWLRWRRRPPRAAIGAAAFLLPLFVWSTALSAGPPAELTIHFFDVGQGDGALIQAPEGANVLIDAGPKPGVVATDLEALGVKRLDLVVASHQHADHVVGLPEVLARFPVGLVLEPGCAVDGAPYQRDLDRAIADEHLPVQYPRAGDTYTVGALRLDVLSPDRCWQGTNSDPNNDSIVMRVTYREDTVLMTGDAEREAQQVMLDDHEPLSAEVMKMPHHGGNTNLPEFFQAIDPEVSVVSVGQPNPYGHPSPEALAELAATGSDIWRTDQHGDVTVTFQSTGTDVRSDR